jgi:hypothetical protein
VAKAGTVLADRERAWPSRLVVVAKNGRNDITGMARPGWDETSGRLDRRRRSSRRRRSATSRSSSPTRERISAGRSSTGARWPKSWNSCRRARPRKPASRPSASGRRMRLWSPVCARTARVSGWPRSGPTLHET